MTEQSPTRVVAETVRVGAMRGGKEERKKALFAGGGVLGAITMTSCCIMPLVLFSLGATGAWIGGLAALYQYRWIFFLVTAGLIGGGFYLVYRKAPASECAPGTYCASPVSDRINKIALWSASVVALVALAFPYVSPYWLVS